MSLFDDILLAYSLLLIGATFVAICAATWIAGKIQGPPKTTPELSLASSHERGYEREPRRSLQTRWI